MAILPIHRAFPHRRPVLSHNSVDGRCACFRGKRYDDMFIVGVPLEDCLQAFRVAATLSVQVKTRASDETILTCEPHRRRPSSPGHGLFFIIAIRPKVPLSLHYENRVFLKRGCPSAFNKCLLRG